MAPYFLLPTLLICYLASLDVQSNDSNWKETDSRNLKAILQLSRPEVQQFYQSELKRVTNGGDVKVLNRIFVGQMQNLNPNLRTAAERKGFNIDSNLMQYRRWLHENGWGKIEVDPHALTKDTILLFQTVKFRYDWEYPFDIKYHKWIRFWVDNYRYKLVSGMHFEAVFPTATLCGLQIVALPFRRTRHHSAALMIVMPNTVTGLRNELKRLRERQQNILNAEWVSKPVNVDLPIFVVSGVPQAGTLMELVSASSLCYFSNDIFAHLYISD